MFIFGTIMFNKGLKLQFAAEISVTAEFRITVEFLLSLSHFLQLRSFGKNSLSVTHYEKERHSSSVIIRTCLWVQSQCPHCPQGRSFTSLPPLTFSQGGSIRAPQFAMIVKIIHHHKWGGGHAMLKLTTMTTIVSNDVELTRWWHAGQRREGWTSWRS